MAPQDPPAVMRTAPPQPRAIRASYDDTTITVYQAYSPTIAMPAVRAGTFVAPFKRDRMTWIKPSFLWMMYRSGWASKAGQENILAVTITRSGFEEALDAATLTSFDATMYDGEAAWRRRLSETDVRVQWDPERSVSLEPLSHRSLQVGLRGAAVADYVDRWIVDIADVSGLARSVHDLVKQGDRPGASKLLPSTSVYPLPVHLAARIGASQA